nr:uncharacterized protein LOC111510323 [Leptinotarsa decemlineata]
MNKDSQPADVPITTASKEGATVMVLLNITNALPTESVSPVTLSDHWSRLARLILLASLATLGSVGNVFMISAVMIEDYLRKRGILFKSRANFKAPITFNWDCTLMQSNMYSFIVFIIFWMPFGVVLAVGTVRKIPDSLFYNLAWLAISKSCINNILYCISNPHFRSAYINLFHYCCCKTTVSFSRRQRPEGLRPSGDVRVHIIPGYNMYCSPQRGRETQSKRLSSRTNGRDVYEL